MREVGSRGQSSFPEVDLFLIEITTANLPATSYLTVTVQRYIMMLLFAVVSLHVCGQILWVNPAKQSLTTMCSWENQRWQLHMSDYRYKLQLFKFILIIFFSFLLFSFVYWCIVSFPCIIHSSYIPFFTFFHHRPFFFCPIFLRAAQTSSAFETQSGLFSLLLVCFHACIYRYTVS